MRRQGPSKEEARELRRQKLSTVAGKDRVIECVRRLGRLKQQASSDDDAARAVLLEVIQILQPLTNRPSKAVMRSDLPPLARLRDGSLPLRVDLTASVWGGRQDVDVVALFEHHRPQFEQIYRVLADWWVAYRTEKIRLRRFGNEDEHGDADDDSDSGEGDPDLGSPFAATLAPLVKRFNDSDQTEADFDVIITSIRDWLSNLPRQPPWPTLLDRQRERLRAMLAEVLGSKRKQYP